MAIQYLLQYSTKHDLPTLSFPASHQKHQGALLTQPLPPSPCFPHKTPGGPAKNTLPQDDVITCLSMPAFLFTHTNNMSCSQCTFYLNVNNSYSHAVCTHFTQHHSLLTQPTHAHPTKVSTAHFSTFNFNHMCALLLNLMLCQCQSLSHSVSALFAVCLHVVCIQYLFY